jgi:DNA repair photolyase
MSVIYEPKGKAREYSPQALNLYLGCPHNCLYCYAPSAMQKTRESYFCIPQPRKGVIDNLKKEAPKAKKEQILLSFIGDVYSQTEDDNKTTMEALEILSEEKLPVAILTKGGKRALKDIEVFKKFGDHFHIGTTLTFDKEEDSLKYESGAALPSERIQMLMELHNAGIKTFASFEPVIDTEQSLTLIKKTISIIDTFKVGKINNFQGIDKTIDWTEFLSKVVEILRDNKKAFYIKLDLRQAAPSIKLYGNECLPDEHNVR